MLNLNHKPRQKTILSLTQAAQVTGYSRRHLLRLLQQERVRTFDIGRKRFILAATLDEWARERESSGKVCRADAFEAPARLE